MTGLIVRLPNGKVLGRTQIRGPIAPCPEPFAFVWTDAERDSAEYHAGLYTGATIEPAP